MHRSFCWFCHEVAQISVVMNTFLDTLFSFKLSPILQSINNISELCHYLGSEQQGADQTAQADLRL